MVSLFLERVKKRREVRCDAKHSGAISLIQLPASQRVSRFLKGSRFEIVGPIFMKPIRMTLSPESSSSVGSVYSTSVVTVAVVVAVVSVVSDLVSSS